MRQPAAHPVCSPVLPPLLPAHSQVHAVVSRLIADDGLPASHDQPTGTVVVHHVEPTRLQVRCCPMKKTSVEGSVR